MLNSPQSSSRTAPPAPPTLWLSLATGPVLLVLVASQPLQRLWQELGQASEELLRGERLPGLTGPDRPGGTGSQGSID